MTVHKFRMVDPLTVSTPIAHHVKASFLQTEQLVTQHMYFQVSEKLACQTLIHFKIEIEFRILKQESTFASTTLYKQGNFIL